MFLALALDFKSLSEGTATHFVAGITWGGRTIVSARQFLPPGADRAQYEARLDESFKNFDETLSSPPAYSNHFDDAIENEPEVRFCSDFSSADDDSRETDARTDAFLVVKFVL
ncbi:hypothetical protein H2198_002049 [Neophaeococcomyces mojaviensis]|uniref:Uncharacterized protein n=1 Tax=Neophaeococcomyces mojaviensis TaxID=3383035 RepID=A0ACC3AFT0_9EURO|nr:hypothetical protein H2198_002049 [Knufia sp. JES_112]